MTITFVNPIAVSGSLFALDFASARMAANGLTFTNGTNVTSVTGYSLIMNNGAFIESRIGSRVETNVLTR